MDDLEWWALRGGNGLARHEAGGVGAWSGEAR
jgi:hypothetical protein